MGKEGVRNEQKGEQGEREGVMDGRGKAEGRTKG